MPDTSRKQFVFLALNVSNNFATFDYDAQTNIKLDNTFNQVFRSMIVQELNTFRTFCEVERNKLVTIKIVTPNRTKSIFYFIEGSTAWLYDCPHFLSPLYKADRCFDRKPIHYKSTLMYVDPITIKPMILSLPYLLTIIL